MNQRLNLKVDNPKEGAQEVFDLTASSSVAGKMSSRKILFKKAQDLTLTGWSENLDALRDSLARIALYAESKSVDKKVDAIEFFKDEDNGVEMCRFVASKKKKNGSTQPSIREVSLAKIEAEARTLPVGTTYHLRRVAFTHFQEKAPSPQELCSSFVSVLFSFITTPIAWLYELFTKPDKLIHDQVASILPVEKKGRGSLSHDNTLEQIRFLKRIVENPSEQSEAPDTQEVAKILDYAYLHGRKMQEASRTRDGYKKRAIAEEISEQIAQYSVRGAYVSKDENGVLRRIRGPLLLPVGAGEGKHATSHFLLFDRQANGDLHFKHIRNLPAGTRPEVAETVFAYKLNYTTQEELAGFIQCLIDFPNSDSEIYKKYAQQGEFEGERYQDPLANFFVSAPLSINAGKLDPPIAPPPAAGPGQKKRALCTPIELPAKRMDTSEMQSRDPLLLLFTTLREISQADNADLVDLDRLDIAKSKAYFYTSYIQEYITFIEKNEKRLTTAEKLHALRGIQLYLVEAKRHLEIEIGVADAHAICDHLEKYLDEKLAREDRTKKLEDDQLEHLNRKFRPALKNTRLQKPLPKEVAQVKQMKGAKNDELVGITIAPKTAQTIETIREIFHECLTGVNPSVNKKNKEFENLNDQDLREYLLACMTDVVEDAEKLLASGDKDNCEAAKYILKGLSAKLPISDKGRELFWNKLSLEELTKFSKLLNDISTKFFEAIVKSPKRGAEGKNQLFAVSPEETLEFNIVLRLVTDHLYQRIIEHAPEQFDKEWVKKIEGEPVAKAVNQKEEMGLVVAGPAPAAVKPSPSIVAALQAAVAELAADERARIEKKVEKLLEERYEKEDELFKIEQERRLKKIEALQGQIQAIRDRDPSLYEDKPRQAFRNIIGEYLVDGGQTTPVDPANKRGLIVEAAFEKDEDFIELKKIALLCYENRKLGEDSLGRKYYKATQNASKIRLKYKVKQEEIDDADAEVAACRKAIIEECRDRDIAIELVADGEEEDDGVFDALSPRFDLNIFNLLRSNQGRGDSGNQNDALIHASREKILFDKIREQFLPSIEEEKEAEIKPLEAEIEATQKEIAEEEAKHEEECRVRKERDLPQQQAWACGRSIFIQQICRPLFEKKDHPIFLDPKAFKKFLLEADFAEATPMEIEAQGIKKPEKAILGELVLDDTLGDQFYDEPAYDMNGEGPLTGKRHLLFGRLLRGMNFDGEILGNYIDAINYNYVGSVRTTQDRADREYLLWDDENFHFAGDDKVQERYKQAMDFYFDLRKQNGVPLNTVDLDPSLRFQSILPHLPRAKGRKFFKFLDGMVNRIQDRGSEKLLFLQKARNTMHSERLIEGFSLQRRKGGRLTLEERKEVHRMRTRWATGFCNESEYDDVQKVTPLVSRARVRSVRHEAMVEFLEQQTVSSFETTSAVGFNHRSKQLPEHELRRAVQSIASKKRVHLFADDSAMEMEPDRVGNLVGDAKDDDFLMPCFALSSSAEQRRDVRFAIDLEHMVRSSLRRSELDQHSHNREEYMGEIGLEAGVYGNKGRVRTEAQMAVYGKQDYPGLDRVQQLLANTLLLYKDKDGMISPNSISQLFNFLNRRDNLVLLAKESLLRSRFYHIMYHLDPRTGRSLLEKAMMETDEKGEILLGADGKPLIRPIVNQWLNSLESIRHGFLEENEEENLPALMMYYLLKDTMRRYLVQTEGEENAVQRPGVLTAEKATLEARAFFAKNKNINQKFAAYYLLEFYRREEEQFKITQASGVEVLQAYYCLRRSPVPGDLHDRKKQIEQTYLATWLPAIASLEFGELAPDTNPDDGTRYASEKAPLSDLLDNVYEKRFDIPRWKRTPNSWKRVEGQPNVYECQGVTKGEDDQPDKPEMVRVDLSTLEGIRFEMTDANRKEIPKAIRESKAFKKLHGSNFKQLVRHRGRPGKGEVQEYEWTDKKTKVVHSIVCTIRENDLPWKAFQKLPTGEKYMYMPMSAGDQELQDKNVEENGIADGVFDYGIRRFLQKSTSPQIEEIIKDKGMWLPLWRGSKTKIDTSKDVLVPFYGNDLTRNPLALVIKNKTIQRVYAGGSERLHVLSSPYSSDTRPLKFLSNLRGFLLLGNDEGMLKEIRFPTRAERSIYESVHETKKNRAKGVENQAEGEEQEVAEEIPLVLTRSKTKQGKERWYVKGRADWEWQLDHTEEVAALYGPNWRNYVLPLINRKSGKHEYVIFPYQPYAPSGEKTGDVRFMRGMQDIFSFLGPDKMVEFVEKNLNEVLRTYDEEQREEIRQETRTRFAGIKSDEEIDEAIEEALEKYVSLGTHIPFKITPAFVKSLLDALTSAVGGFDTIAELLSEFSKRGNNQEQNRRKKELLNFSSALADKLFVSLSEFISPQSFVLKEGKSGDESTHFGFFYLSHMEALRGNFTRAADYLNKMIDRGVSSDVDVDQFEQQLMPMLFLELGRKIGMMPGEFKTLLESSPAKLMKFLQDGISSFVDSNNPAEIAFEIKRIISLVKVARILSIKKQKDILQGKEAILLEFAGALYEKNLEFLNKNQQSLKESNLHFDSSEQELLSALFLTNTFANFVGVVGSPAKRHTPVPFEQAPKPDFFQEKELEKFSRAVAAYHAPSLSIQEIHKKHGKAPKADTVLAHFFDYAHWILHKHPTASDVHFLTTNLEGDSYSIPDVEAHKPDDPYEQGLIKARINGLRAQHPYNIDMARRWLLYLFNARESFGNTEEGLRQLQELQGLLAQCSSRRKQMGDRTDTERAQAKKLHAKKPFGLIPLFMKDALKKKRLTAFVEREIGNQRFTVAGPHAEFKASTLTFMKSLSEKVQSLTIVPVSPPPVIAPPPVANPEKMQAALQNLLIKGAVRANPKILAEQEAIRDGEISQERWAAQADKLAETPVSLPIAVQKPLSYDGVNEYYESCFFSSPEMEEEIRTRAEGVRNALGQENANGDQRQKKVQQEKIDGVNHAEEDLLGRIRKSILDRNKLVELREFLTAKQQDTFEKKEKMAKRILKKVERYHKVLGLSHLISDRKGFTDEKIINDYLLDLYQNGTLSQLGNSSLQTVFEEEITEYLFLATEWKQQKDAFATLDKLEALDQKLEGQTVGNADWALISYELKQFLIRGHDRYRFCSYESTVDNTPILEESEFARHALVTEYREGWISRDFVYKGLKAMMADIRTRMQKYPDDPVTLTLLFTGAGKTSYVFKNAAQISVDCGRNPVIVTSDKLVKQLFDGLNESTPGKPIMFEFDFDTMGVHRSKKELDKLQDLEKQGHHERADRIRDEKTEAHLKRLKNTLYSLQERRKYIVTTPSKMAALQNKHVDLLDQYDRLCTQGLKNSAHAESLARQITLLEEIDGYLRNTRIGIFHDEDINLDVGFEYNIATGQETRTLDRIHYTVAERILHLLRQHQRSIDPATGKLIPSLGDRFLGNKLRALPSDPSKLPELLDAFDTYRREKAISLARKIPVKKIEEFIDPLKSIEHTMVYLVGKLIENDNFWTEREDRTGLTFGGAGFSPEEWEQEKGKVMRFVFAPKQENEPSEIDLGDRRLNKEHSPYRYLAALKRLMASGKAFNTVYQVNAELSRGLHTKNGLGISPYQDGQEKLKVQYGNENEMLFHHLMAYGFGGGNFTSEQIFDTQFKLFKQDKETPISFSDSYDSDPNSSEAQVRAKYGLKNPTNWQEWANNITIIANQFGFALEAGGEFHVLSGTQMPDAPIANQEELKEVLQRERWLYLRWAIYQSGKIKVYPEQWVCNSRSLARQHMAMASATGDFGLGLFKVGDNLVHRDDSLGETLLLTNMQAAVPAENIFGNESADALAFIQKCAAEPNCIGVINQDYAVEGGSMTALIRTLRQTSPRRYHYRNEQLEKCTWEPNASSAVAYSYDRIEADDFTCYGPGDSRGVDFKMQTGADKYVVLMVGLDTTLDAYIQARGRARKLGFGQSMKHAFDEKMEERIRRDNNLSKEDQILEIHIVNSIILYTIRRQEVKNIKSATYEAKEIARDALDHVVRSGFAFDSSTLSQAEQSTLMEMKAALFASCRSLYSQKSEIDWEAAFKPELHLNCMEYMRKIYAFEQDKLAQRHLEYRMKMADFYRKNPNLCLPFSDQTLSEKLKRLDDFDDLTKKLTAENAPKLTKENIRLVRDCIRHKDIGKAEPIFALKSEEGLFLQQAILSFIKEKAIDPALDTMKNLNLSNEEFERGCKDILLGRDDPFYTKLWHKMYEFELACRKSEHILLLESVFMGDERAIKRLEDIAQDQDAPRCKAMLGDIMEAPAARKKGGEIARPGVQDFIAWLKGGADIDEFERVRVSGVSVEREITEEHYAGNLPPVIRTCEEGAEQEQEVEQEQEIEQEQEQEQEQENEIEFQPRERASFQNAINPTEVVRGNKRPDECFARPLKEFINGSNAQENEKLEELFRHMTLSDRAREFFEVVGEVRDVPTPVLLMSEGWSEDEFGQPIKVIHSSIITPTDLEDGVSSWIREQDAKARDGQRDESASTKVYSLSCGALQERVGRGREVEPMMTMDETHEPISLGMLPDGERQRIIVRAKLFTNQAMVEYTESELCSLLGLVYDQPALCKTLEAVQGEKTEKNLGIIRTQLADIKSEREALAELLLNDASSRKVKDLLSDQNKSQKKSASPDKNRGISERRVKSLALELMAMNKLRDGLSINMYTPMELKALVEMWMNKYHPAENFVKDLPANSEDIIKMIEANAALDKITRKCVNSIDVVGILWDSRDEDCPININAVENSLEDTAVQNMESYRKLITERKGPKKPMSDAPPSPREEEKDEDKKAFSMDDVD